MAVFERLTFLPVVTDSQPTRICPTNQSIEDIL